MIEQGFLYYGRGFDPYRNIADEALLLESVEEGQVILYLWQNQQTVVIGRNQNAWEECRVELLEKEGGHLARRLSGGGAVYHDLGNVNFTFLVRDTDYDLDRQNLVIKRAMEKLGLNIERSGRNDLLIDGRKFSGHAYYKQGPYRYHHGTILVDVDTEAMARYLQVSQNKMQSKGVKSVRSRVCNLVEFIPDLKSQTIYDAFVEAVKEVYPVPFKEGSWDKFSPTLQAEKYAFISSPQWLYGPKIPLSLQVKDRFNWGEVSLELLVNRGLLEELRIYSDAMDWDWVKVLEKSLTGLPFREAALKEAFNKIQTKKSLFSDVQAKDMLGLLRKLFE